MPARALADEATAPRGTHENGGEEVRAEGVVLAVDATLGLSSEQLRDALARELGVPVSLASAQSTGALRVVVQAASPGRAMVLLHRNDGRQSGREVELPARSPTAVDIVALVATNLVFNEAGEILAELRAHVAISTTPVAEAPTPLPAATPAPQPAPSPPPPALAVRPRPARRDPCSRSDLPAVPVGVDLVPSVGTSLVEPRPSVRQISLGILGSHTTFVHGAALSSIWDVNTDALCGAQLAGVAVIGSGDVVGYQVSGVVAISTGRLSGAQGSGVIAWAHDQVDGAQLAGSVAVAASNVHGVQASGTVAYAGSISGAQLAMLSIARQSVHGAQVGNINVAGEVSGAQVGLVNVSAGDVQGSQVGMANVAAGHANVMVGLVNIAADADVPIGLINVFYRGRTHVIASGNEIGFMSVALEHGTRRFHSIYGIGAMPFRENRVWAPELGIGFHADLSDSPWWLDVDLIHRVMIGRPAGFWHDAYYGLSTLRVVVGYKLMDGFGLFAAPSLNVSTTPTTDTEFDYGPPLGEHDTVRGTVRIGTWPGLTLGVRLL